MSSPLVFAIVAGEASGDALGADLIDYLKLYFPHARFEGVGGSLMQEKGFNSLFDIERLSVMGIFEPLKRLPELLSIRHSILKRFRANRPAVYIGIDSPDFNLPIELKLRRLGVKTVHYVSPTVWAWRQGRIRTIKKCVDLMLTLLPFESDFYKKNGVPVRYVGHPLANQYEMNPNRESACQSLHLNPDIPILALMPGSRNSEIKMMADLFLDVVMAIRSRLKNLQVVLPAASEQLFQHLREIIGKRPETNVRLLLKQSKLAMTASNVVLLTSGTTALEAMLLKKPMVVSYKMGFITYGLVSPFIRTPFISLPNLLAGKRLVPELIQADATIEKLTKAVISSFNTPTPDVLESEFVRLHELLDRDSGMLAAEAIVELIKC